MLHKYSSSIYRMAGRLISTSSCCCGRRSREPYDKRWGPHPKDVGPHRPGGSEELAHKLGREHGPQVPGYDKDGKFHIVPEMIPEFVVPDLTGFKLKPYVSYRVKEIQQSEFTSKDLFDAVYRQKVLDAYERDDFNLDKILDSGKEVEKMDKLETRSPEE